MGIKFNCPECGKVVIGKYIKPSDRIICPHCQSEVSVPSDISETDEESNIMRIQKEKAMETSTSEDTLKPNSEIIAYIVMVIGFLLIVSGLFFPLLIPAQAQFGGGEVFVLLIFAANGILIIAFGKGLSCLLKLEYNSRITNSLLEKLLNK